MIPRFQSAAFSFPCFLCFLITLPFLGCQKFLRAALILDLTRGFRPSADFRGGHLNGLLTHGSLFEMSFLVLNLTLNLDREGLGLDLGGCVTITPGIISSLFGVTSPPDCTKLFLGLSPMLIFCRMLPWLAFCA